MNKQFPQGKIETVNKHLRKCSVLVVIKEMQIKANLKYHLTPTKLAFLKMIGWQGDTDTGTLIHFKWCYKLVLPLRKHYDKHRETFLPFDPVIVVFAVSTKEKNSVEAKRLSTVPQSLSNSIKFN